MTTVPPGFELPGDRKSWTELTESCGGEWRAVVAQAARQRASAPADAPGPRKPGTTAAPWPPARPLAPAPASGATALAVVPVVPAAAAAAGEPRLADVSKLRRGRSLATQLGPDLWQIPTSSGTWAVSTAEGPEAVLPRGLYQRTEAAKGDGGEDQAPRYQLRARLPYVHCRIIRRDGSGKVTGTDYLISAERDSARVVADHRAVRSGEWAGMVLIPLADDMKIAAAAGTAIRYMKPLDGEDQEREAVPRMSPAGRALIPAAETLPAGYLQCGPLPSAEALRQWAEIIAPIAAANPDFALVMGAATIGPFVEWLDHADVKAYFIELVGDPNAGKSTAMRCAGAIWGAVPKGGTGVVASWNMSAQGPGRHLGMLGNLPGFLDELGVAGFGPDKRQLIILGETDGPRRAADRGAGIRGTLPHSGVVVSAGNSSLTAGLGAGGGAGIGPKRVNTLNGPFTSSPEQAESAGPVMRDAHGHPGRVILETFTGPDAAALLLEARRMIPLPAGVVARSAAKNMQLNVAGAMILDRVFGTGSIFRDSAVKAALGYLSANAADPEHDADRMLTALRDSMAVEPARWPTVAEYRESAMPRPEWTPPSGHRDPERAELPQHGVALNRIGVRADDGSWFAVFRAHLNEILAEAGADRALCLAEADRRGWLHRTASDRKTANTATKIKGVGPRMIRLDLPADDDDQDQAADPGPAPSASSGADLPPGCPECDATLPTHGAECSRFPEWAAVMGAGDSPAASTACADCGTTLSPVLVAQGARYHVCCGPESAEVGPEPSSGPAAVGTPPSPLETAPAESDPAPAVPRPAPAPAPAPVAEPGQAAELDRAAELKRWARDAAKLNDEWADADVTAGLDVFHRVTDGTEWRSYPGQVGQAWFARLAARYPSIKAPAPVASPKLAEITESGPLTRVNYSARPRTAIKAGKHFTVSYDINGEHMAAAGSAEMGDGEPLTAVNPRDITGLTKYPGYVKFARNLKTGHPGLGTIAAGSWVAMPLVKFMIRDLELTVEAAEVVYWPKFGQRLSVYTKAYRDARAALTDGPQTGGGLVALAMLKSQANAFIGMFHSETYSHGGFYRPDWYDMVVATAEANALRAMRKCPRAPVAKMADSAYWITDVPPCEGCQRDDPAAHAEPCARPEGLTVSTQLGKWKLDRHGPVTPELIEALRLGPAATRDAVISINAERLAGNAV